MAFLKVSYGLEDSAGLWTPLIAFTANCFLSPNCFQRNASSIQTALAVA
jgi:hypothetical protein